MKGIDVSTVFLRSNNLLIPGVKLNNLGLKKEWFGVLYT